MNETPRQYIARLLGYVKSRDSLKTLRSTGPAVGKLLRRTTRARHLKRPRRGTWSAGEILAHLAESELVFGYRLRKVLERNGTPIQAFDQNDWQKNARYLYSDPAAAFELFNVLRKNNIALLASLPKRKWKRFGKHSERGKETIARMVDLEAGHDVNHLKQLRLLLG